MGRTGREISTRQVQSVGIAVLLSLMGLLFHTGLEFGLEGLLALETGTIPIIIIEVGLFVIWWRVPSLRNVAMAALGFLALLHLIGGAIISVLPLEALPFEPEQSLEHYFSHLVYGLGQLPLIWYASKWLFSAKDQKQTSAASSHDLN